MFEKFFCLRLILLVLSLFLYIIHSLGNALLMFLYLSTTRRMIMDDGTLSWN